MVVPLFLSKVLSHYLKDDYLVQKVFGSKALGSKVFRFERLRYENHRLHGVGLSSNLDANGNTFPLRPSWEKVSLSTIAEMFEGRPRCCRQMVKRMLNNYLYLYLFGNLRLHGVDLSSKIDASGSSFPLLPSCEKVAGSHH